MCENDRLCITYFISECPIYASVPLPFYTKIIKNYPLAISTTMYAISFKTEIRSLLATLIITSQVLSFQTALNV
jgi:hypothetical protein